MLILASCWKSLLYYNLLAVGYVNASRHGDEVSALHEFIEYALTVNGVDAELLFVLAGDDDSSVTRGDGLSVAIGDGIVDACLAVGLSYVELLAVECELGEVAAAIGAEVVEYAEAHLGVLPQDEVNTAGIGYAGVSQG